MAQSSTGREVKQTVSNLCSAVRVRSAKRYVVERAFGAFRSPNTGSHTSLFHLKHWLFLLFHRHFSVNGGRLGPRR